MTRSTFRATLLGLGAAAVLAAGPAGADTPVNLPGGHDQMAAPDGVRVTIDRTSEHALISGSMVSSPLSRNVWVSGVTSTRVIAPKGVKVTGGTIETGYLLGCQVDLSKGFSVGSGNAGSTLGPYGSYYNYVSPYFDPDMSLTLAPGKVVGAKVDSFDFTGLSGTTQYVDHTLSVEGCLGFAQARAYTTVTVHDNVMDDQETLWGQPFSIG
jgi:hypothetical protein